ncbi:YceI family protein [Arthrobacter sp. TWP1-1]|uniref:YceI family protein n=1 Tax=Arthrobacter sp. TWP1-1 TaxID=2804568 RepID=UPI003CF750DD
MRKKWIIIGVVAVLVIVGGLWGGSAIYASLENSKAPDHLALSTPSASAAATGAATGSATADSQATADAGNLAGEWKVADGSQAGYRVKEVLNGQDVTVVGRTEGVEGSATIEGTNLTATQVSVDLTGVTTDNGSRDSQFLGILKTSEFPSATFTLTEPVDIAAVSTGVATVKAVGDLTIAGTTKSVTVDLQAQTTGSAVEVQGSIPITFTDFGISAPDLGFVKVEDAGSIEMLLQLSK